MNLFTQAAAACVLLTLLAGCRSYGPRFDAHKASRALEGEARDGQAHKLFRLEPKAFTALERTNQVSPDWLQPPSDFFRLGPSDVIEIELLGESVPRATVAVGPDGKIYYGLLPGVFVWGLTLAEVRDTLMKEMGKFLRAPPTLAVTLKAVGSKRIWILGSVQQPGVYHMAAPMTLLEAIALAGGTHTAGGSTEEVVDLQNSFVMREGQVLRVDFRGLLRQGDLSQNLYLQPDDFVYVRPAVARSVYVMGAVGRPNVIDFTSQISLVTAIASAGGPAPYAHLTQVAVVRGSIATPGIALVDYKAIVRGKEKDVLLEAGDIVYVPFSPCRGVAIFGEQVLRQFVYALAINEGYRAVIRGPAPVGVSVGLGGR
jgi:protein involved in polysaccharide export with SLBB domain